MSTLSSNRGMWLLKITSKHHTPERLAWAVALGLLAGLLPKLNLLAAGLYLIILLAPIHTLMAIAISIAVSLLAPQLDAVTDRLGQFLLTQPVLSWLWATLDNAPILPWLALHNTVVLGSLVIALATTAPAYMLSLRLFEHWEYDVPRASEHNYASTATELPPLVAPPSLVRRPSPPERWDKVSGPHLAAKSADTNAVQVEQLPSSTVPPPKLADSRRGSLMAGRESHSHSDVDQHASVNQWHIGASLPERQFQAAQVAPNSDAARASAPPNSSSIAKNSIIDSQPVDSGQDVDRQRWVPVGDIYPESTWRGDVVDSLQVAQNASDVLAWVEEMLDECLVDASTSIITGESCGPAEGYCASGGSTTDPAISESPTSGTTALGLNTAGSSATRILCDEAYVAPGQAQTDGGQSDQPRWLVETTIEIVRWADETISQLGQTSAEPTSMSNPGQVLSEPMQGSIDRSGKNRSEGLVRDSVLFQTGRGQTGSGSEELTILPIEGAVKGAQAAGLRSNSPSDYQHLVMAGGSQAMERTKPLEDVSKGECLGYLLGHLRQAREGKSS